MGTAQDGGRRTLKRRALAYGAQVFLSHRIRDGTGIPALFRQRNKERTGQLFYDGLGIQLMYRLCVCEPSRRRFCCQNYVPVAAAQADRGGRAWLYDPYHRQGRQFFAQNVQRYRRCRVAGDDQQLNAPGYEVVRRMQCITFDGFRTLGPIRNAGRVTEVDQLFVRQQLMYRMQNGQPTHAGIKYAYRQIRIFSHLVSPAAHACAGTG